MLPEPLITELAGDYLAEVAACLAQFRDQYGRSDLLRAWRSGALPQTGPLGDGRYEMHGYGCAVTRAGQTLDFDFADSDAVGFDAWRLWKFSKRVPGRWPGFSDLASVQRALEKALSQTTVSRAVPGNRAEGSSELYLLTLGVMGGE